MDEIDRLIKGKFEIEVASSGVDDKLFIFITNEDYKDLIKRFIVDKTKLNPAAFHIMVIQDIPKNGAGKILYSELNKYYS